MNDKPEMSAEERAKLKAELRAEIKEEIRSEFVTTPRELPPTDNEELLEYRDKWSDYHCAETYYGLAREEHIKFMEEGVWEYSEREECSFLRDAEFEDDHPYYIRLAADLRDRRHAELMNSSDAVGYGAHLGCGMLIAILLFLIWLSSNDRPWGPFNL